LGGLLSFSELLAALHAEMEVTLARVSQHRDLAPDTEEFRHRGYLLLRESEGRVNQGANRQQHVELSLEAEVEKVVDEIKVRRDSLKPTDSFQKFKIVLDDIHEGYMGAVFGKEDPIQSHTRSNIRHFQSLEPMFVNFLVPSSDLGCAG
jgi:hypothetical protein